MVNPDRHTDLCKTLSELLGRVGDGGGCLLVEVLRAGQDFRAGMGVVSAAIVGVERLAGGCADDDDIVGALGGVCEAAGVSGAAIYAGGSCVDDLTAVYRWGSAIRVVSGEGLSLSHFDRWRAGLARGEVISGRVDNLPADERAVLGRLGVLSVAAVPVLHDGELDSVIVFEDALTERKWSDEQLAGLVQAGRVLSAGLRLWGSAEAARQQTPWPQLLAEAGGLAVKVIGPDGRIRYWNRGCEVLYGYSADEAVGSDVADLIVPPERRELIRQAIGQGFRTGSMPAGGEQRAVGKDGGELWVIGVAQVVSGPEGPADMYLLDVDVTDMKRRQEEGSLLHRQLHGARKMETISHLIGGVAHHFNNALTVIQGNAELIHKSHADDEDLRELVDQILLATMVSSQLTSQLLSYSRMERHEKTHVDVHEAVRSVVQKLSEEMEPPPQIATDLRADPHVIEADDTQLRSALTNLGINACEATRAGGQILLATEIVELDEAFCAAYPQDITPGRHMCVTVRDTGVGMDSQTLQRAFEPFFTTKPFGKGHGLGLASVYGCAMSHNGAVNLTSEPGRGSTVQLFLPLVQAEGERAGGDEPGPAARRGSVMVVDNEVSARQTLEVMLSRSGYGVVVFGNGADGVEYYRTRAESIDLVIVDVNMPTMDGRETFRQLKEINPQVRGLLSSGLLLASDAQAILDEGAKGFLSKPYESAATLQQVARAIKE